MQGYEKRKDEVGELAEAFNAMNPEYIGMLTLMVEPGTPLYDWVHDGSFRLLDQHQVLKETELLVSSLRQPRQCVPHESRQQLSGPPGHTQSGPGCSAGQDPSG